jgi:inner membrane protein
MKTIEPITNKLSNSISFKLLVILFLILLLQIPLSYVRGLIYERQSLQAQAQSTISQRWGGAQSLGAPFVVYETLQRTYKKVDGKQAYEDNLIYKSILSESLTIDLNIDAEKRYLGIYEAAVFKSEILIKGQVDLNVVKSSELIESQSPLKLFIPIQEMKGLKKIRKLLINGKQKKLSKKQIHFNHLKGVVVDLEYNANIQSIIYDIELDLAGSQKFDILPMAGDTSVKIKSNWPSPSFIGDFLPEQRNINDSGFQAQWQVNELNHNLGRVLYPNKESSHNYNYPSFGVKIHIPANIYQVNQRTVKYSFLIILLTFAGFFLAELFFKLRLHPFQYLLIGVSLSVFYLLLLSLSEFLSFGISFLFSSISIIVLIAGYCSVVLGQRIRGIYTGVLFSLLYGFIYILVNAEQTSLLMGSIGIWVFLALVMYITRKINWYDLNNSHKE